jgi:hypothetical protein
MSVKDVIKNSVYESFGAGAGLTFGEICLILFAACLVGAFIYFVYKNFSKSAFYSKDLNMTLAGLTVIVAAIMVAMQSNLLVSLGMVGALSIVRFRTAVKNPIDLLYLFWSISEGIICGVGLYALAAVLCVIMPILLWILWLVPNSKAPALLVIRCDMEMDLSELETSIKKNSKYAKQTSVSVKNQEKEVIYEVNSNKQNVLVSQISRMNGVKSVNWLEHHGEMRG